MKEFCQNPFCENPGAKVVRVSVQRPFDEKRTLCVTCEEAYSWGVQHGTKTAQADASSALDIRVRLNPRELATILAALRFHADENLRGTTTIADSPVRQIATNGGRLNALNFEEIGQLCQRLSPLSSLPKRPGGKRRSRRRKHP